MQLDKGLREKIAKRIAIARGLIRWENLPEKQDKNCGAACQEACFREADQIIELLKGKPDPLPEPDYSSETFENNVLKYGWDKAVEKTTDLPPGENNGVDGGIHE